MNKTDLEQAEKLLRQRKHFKEANAIREVLGTNSESTLVTNPAQSKKTPSSPGVKTDGHGDGEFDE